MRWRSERQSRNVEDRRGLATPLKIGGGVGGLVVLLLVLFLGGDPGAVIDVAAPEGAPGTAGEPRPPPEDDEAARFISAMLASTEDVWGALFQRAGGTYRQPRLVLFEEAVESACGFGTAATGPFYCPADERIYLDLDFFRELARMGGSGDFAAAYVVGHEVGHHVQRLTGTSDRVRALQSRARSEAEANALQVRTELQADCLAGVWAHHANRTRRILEPGDVEEGLAAAGAIGDDRLLRNAGRRVTPESFTHGTSAQRRQWLLRGIETGDGDACDPFEGAL